ncbi:hypothetical protein BH18CHL2_BH18CHL2_07950 [soil metagenome]
MWSLGLPQLAERTAAGWTFKDLLAHVAAWEGRTADRLLAFRETGEFTSVNDADAFNADVVARTADRGGDAVLRDLVAAHARLTAELEALTYEHLRANGAWTAAVVAGNSFDHYAEHQGELFAGVPKTSADLIDRVEKGWRPFRAAVRRIGLTRLRERTFAGWTYQGLLGHVTRWLHGVTDRLPDRLEGRPGESMDVDAENERGVADAESRSAHDVLERLDAGYAAVIAALRALPADREVPFAAVRLVAGETYDHFREHQPELDEARPRTAAELRERIEAVWRPFRGAIRDRGRAGLAERTPTGWTYRDLVAHAAAWMEQAGREVQGRAFTEGWTNESILAFNERAVRARALVGAEALLDELDTAYRRLDETAGSLSGDDLESRTVTGVIAFYTYLHWEEHYGELGLEL